MNFIDRTGHIFSLPSYDVKPIGYEYEESKYIHWLESEYTCKLSIKNWYMLPVRVVSYSEISNIEIISSSSVFKLISSSYIQRQIKENGVIELDEDNDNHFKSILTYEDIILLKDNDETLIPFYVIGKSEETGTFISNILIHITYSSGNEEWCPITVGGDFYDECEQLIINGRNFGIDVPKDAIKAVYQHSFTSDSLDTTIYNDKVKEYLLNMMKLKGECGNLDSALTSLKWFGWGDKISIYKLYKTDNEHINQFIRDNIYIIADNISAYKNFKSTAYLALEVKENAETEEEYDFNFNEDVWGENKPKLENLFDKLVEVKYDEGDIIYYKNYYDYAFEELSLKLAMLTYYYKKMFLPIHITLFSSSINHNTFMNDIKFATQPFNKIVEVPQLLSFNKSIDIIFPDTNVIYFNTNVKYVDVNYNEFSNYKEIGEKTDETIYYSDNIGFDIPLKFISENNSFYDVVILLRKEDKLVFESHFTFNEDETNKYKQLCIIPQLLNGKFNINYWENKNYILDILVNGHWFNYEFIVKMPELQMNFGKLKYDYDENNMKQISSISNDEIIYNAFMHLPSLVDVNNIRFPREVIDYSNKNELLRFINQYRDVHNINDSSKYYNIVHYYKIIDYTTGLELIYDGKDNIELYKHFFNNDGTLKPAWINALQNESSNITYDLYIMHDDIDPETYRGILSESDISSFVPSWYAVLISRETLDKKVNNSDIFAPVFPKEKTYSIKYQKSDEKFLINRMNYISSNGINRFNHDDIIVGHISNADTPFIMALGTKWNIKPFSLKMNDEAEVKSNSNMFIMGLGKSNYIYESGYYDITVRYSLDGFTQQQFKNSTRIFVD